MGSNPGERAPLVTLAALYGAGGSLVGADVAARLGVPFLDRDEHPRATAPRLAAGLGRLSTITGGAGGSYERLDADEGDERGRVERFLAEATRSGGVALGRGGMVVLRSVPWALHVHLGGPEAQRLAQAMELGGLDRAVAAARQQAEDAARRSYVRRTYGVDGTDHALYHLMLDATALGLGACVDLIVTAAVARTRDPRPSPSI
jgi:cytidylate kinase